MTDNAANNRLIARNTLFLYFRTILIMLVTLYTSRVVLNSLGVEDYGVYNAVGGVVAMFAVISGALSNAISRYLTYNIGKDDIEKLKVVFSTSVRIQIVISLVVFMLCEFVGIWFLNHKMNIPADRMYAANWVLHCSLLTFVVNLISVPYNACIIAHEHMKAYAYISILDAILKLAVAYCLTVSPVDKLIAYAVLLLVASIGVRLMYGAYCLKHFAECRYVKSYDKGLFREMLGFAGWNFFGNATSIINTQGIDLLINVFFGVIANSARGIASQVQAAMHQFVTTFTTAVNPQITKSYAQGDRDRMNYLICKGAKFSYFLLLVFSVPILLETETILQLWLVDVPEDAALFTRLGLISTMITILGNSGYTACLATGDIRTYSIVITIVGSMNFIITWIAYKAGASVQLTYYIYIIVYVFVQIARLILMKMMLDFPIRMYVKEVLGRIVIPTVLSLAIPMFIIRVFPPTMMRFVSVTMISIVWSAFAVMLSGLTKGERGAILARLSDMRSKVLKK